MAPVTDCGMPAFVSIEAERAAAYTQLLKHQFVSKMDYPQFEEQRIDKAQELARQQKKLSRIARLLPRRRSTTGPRCPSSNKPTP